MPKHGNRFDFSEKTKTLCAKRVGYICSRPGCNQFTIGPSSTKPFVNNIGTASHICAAAKNGPRFDANLSEEEIESPDNCIWLCRNCGTLIDNDSGHYTKEELREWKKLAEERASKFLSSQEAASKFLGSSTGLQAIKPILDGLLNKGDFEDFLLFLSMFLNDSKNAEDPILIFEKLKFDSLCNANMVQQDLVSLVRSNDPALCEEVLRFGIELYQPEICKSLAAFGSDQEIKNLAFSVASGKTDGFIRDVDQPNPSTSEKSKYKELINGAATMIAIAQKVRLQDAQGHDCYYQGTAFFKLLVSAHCSMIENSVLVNRSTEDSANIRFLYDNIRLVSFLDVSYQRIIYGALYGNSYGRPDEWGRVNSALSERAAKDGAISVFRLSSMPKDAAEKINPEEIVETATREKEPELLFIYLSHLDPKRGISFLQSHESLFAFDPSLFLSLFSDLAKAGLPLPDPAQYLDEHFKGDKNDPIFRITKDVMCFRSSATPIPPEDVADAMKIAPSIDSFETLSTIADSFSLAKDYQALATLSDQHKESPYLQIEIAERLIASHEKKSLILSKKLLAEYEQYRGLDKDFYKAYSEVCLELGDTQAALHYSEIAYKENGTQQIADLIVQLRWQLKDPTVDSISEKTGRESTNPDVLNVLGLLYQSKDRPEEARQLFLRSALLYSEDANYGLNNLVSSELTNKLPKVQAEEACPFSVVTIRLASNSESLLLLPGSLLVGVSKKTFLGAEIVSIDTKEGSQYLFLKKGDSCSWKDQKWLVDSIVPIWSFLVSPGIEYLSAKGMIKTGTVGSKGHELDSLKELVGSIGSGREEVLHSYWSDKYGLPITLLMNANGKTAIEVFEALFFDAGNVMPANINAVPKADDGVLVLGPDSLFLLSWLGVTSDELPTARILIPLYEKRLLIDEANNELKESEDSANAGFLSISGSKPLFMEKTPEYRRQERTFLKGFLDLLNNFETNDEIESFSEINDEIAELIKERGFLLEEDCSALVQKEKDRTLVTDEKFLNSFAVHLGLKTAGILFLIENIDDPLRQISLLERLQQTNLGVYCTKPLLQSVCQKILILPSEEKEKAEESLSSFVSGRWKDLSEKELSRHKYVVHLSTVGWVNYYSDSKGEIDQLITGAVNQLLLR